MSIIIPYHHDLAVGGAFITPDGEILHLQDNKHQEFAEDYCNGHEFKYYTGAVIGPPAPLLKDYIAEKEVLAAKQGIDIFRSSQLSKSQLAKYKWWLEHYGKNQKDLCVDFLVYVLAFDKVERLVHDVITTTAAEPHVRFFNYYLMDWNISVQNRIIYDYKKGEYRRLDYHFFENDDLDREAEEEINEIKAKVLIKDRPYFFKE
jgi:hypothetical protein